MVFILQKVHITLWIKKVIRDESGEKKISTNKYKERRETKKLREGKRAAGIQREERDQE